MLVTLVCGRLSHGLGLKVQQMGYKICLLVGPSR